MEERAAELYRTHGPGIFARCRRLLGEDAAAATATAQVFVRVQRHLADKAAVDTAIREVCASQRRLIPVPTEDEPTAAELAAAEARFAGEIYGRTLPLVLRDQRPPAILRWVFIYAPIVVACASVGMFLAVRNPRNPEQLGGGRRDATLEVYRERQGHTTRLETGMRVSHGDTLKLILAPVGHRFVTVHANGRVLTRLGPLPPDFGRITLDPFTVEDEGQLRLSAGFGRSQYGLPSTEVAIELGVD